jgi:hypothetical protein
MAVCITRGSLSPQRAASLIRDHNADVKEKDDKGRTALHLALGARHVYHIRNPMSRLVNRFLVDPENDDDEIDANNVHDIDDNDDHDIDDDVDDNDDDDVDDDNDDESDLWSADTPINFELIRVLLKADPEGVKVKDKKGKIPLHSVCESKSPYAAFEVIFNAYPDGLIVRDKEGNIPFEYAPTSVIISFILEKVAKGDGVALRLIASLLPRLALNLNDKLFTDSGFPAALMVLAQEKTVMKNETAAERVISSLEYL